jgi:hypothetical protein
MRCYRNQLVARAVDPGAAVPGSGLREERRRHPLGRSTRSRTCSACPTSPTW